MMCSNKLGEIVPVSPEMRANADKPVRIVRKQGIYIGDEEFPYVVSEQGIKVEPFNKKHNLLTLTLIVGRVTLETSPTSESDGEYTEQSKFPL